MAVEAIVIFSFLILAGALVGIYFWRKRSDNGPKHVGDRSGASNRPEHESTVEQHFNEWKILANTKRGLVDEALLSKSDQPTSEACAQWCQQSQDGIYFNYNVKERECFCAPKGIASDPDVEPLTMCLIADNDWTTRDPTDDNELPIPNAMCPDKKWHLSTCHKNSELQGWPNDRIAKQNYSLEKWASSDSMSCLKRCEDVSKGAAQAAFFHVNHWGEKECKCYMRWQTKEQDPDNVTACHAEDRLFEGAGASDLWTRSPLTGCVSEGRPDAHPLPVCSSKGMCECDCEDIDGKRNCIANTLENNCGERYKATCSETECDPSIGCKCTCKRKPIKFPKYLF